MSESEALRGVELEIAQTAAAAAQQRATQLDTSLAKAEARRATLEAEVKELKAAVSERRRSAERAQAAEAATSSRAQRLADDLELEKRELEKQAAEGRTAIGRVDELDAELKQASVRAQQAAAAVAVAQQWRASALAELGARRDRAAEELEAMDAPWREVEVTAELELERRLRSEGLLAAVQLAEARADEARLITEVAELRARLDELLQEDGSKSDGLAGVLEGVWDTLWDARQRETAEEQEKRKLSATSASLDEARGKILALEKAAAAQAPQVAVVQEECERRASSRRRVLEEDPRLASLEVLATARGALTAYSESLEALGALSADETSAPLRRKAQAETPNEPTAVSDKEAEIAAAYDALKKRAGAWAELSPEAQQRWLQEAQW